MLEFIKALFAKKRRPTLREAPYELLVPDGPRPAEDPKLAAHLVSLLFHASGDVTVFEIAGERTIHCNHGEVKAYLGMVTGARWMDRLVAHCQSLMFPSDVPGALGRMMCLDANKRLHEFTVVQHATPERLRWTIRRHVQESELRKRERATTV